MAHCKDSRGLENIKENFPLWIFGTAETHLYEGFTDTLPPREWWNKSQNHSLMTLFWKIYETPERILKQAQCVERVMSSVTNPACFLCQLSLHPCIINSTQPLLLVLPCSARAPSLEPAVPHSPCSPSWLPHQEMIPWISQMPIIAVRWLQYTFMWCVLWDHPTGLW